MNHFSSARLMILGLAAIGASAVTAPCAAAEVPFSLQGTFTFTFVPNSWLANVTGDGHSAPGGSFTFDDQVRVTRGGKVIEGTLTLEYANGSTLSFYYEAPIENNVASGTFWFVGGTGLFEDATGSGTIEYPIGQNESFTMDGTLDF